MIDVQAHIFDDMLYGTATLEGDAGVEVGYVPAERIDEMEGSRLKIKGRGQLSVEGGQMLDLVHEPHDMHGGCERHIQALGCQLQRGGAIGSEV